jgi:hypothetical protein
MDKYKAEKKASQEKALKLQQEKNEALRAAMTPEDRAKADKRAKRFKLILILIAFAIVTSIIAGMMGGSGTSTTSADSVPVVEDNTGVDWEVYAPAVKTRIEELIQAGDCSNLQAEFDIADQNNAAQQARVGETNADLMNYIDSEMRKLSCY